MKHWEGNYIDGKKDGKWIYWYSDDNIFSDGKIKEYYHYKNGFRHGDWKLINIDENYWEHGEYRNGVQVGLRVKSDINHNNEFPILETLDCDKGECY